jgi:hypothetical protein
VPAGLRLKGIGLTPVTVASFIAEFRKTTYTGSFEMKNVVQIASMLLLSLLALSACAGSGSIAAVETSRCADAEPGTELYTSEEFGY